jgi:hypothetical protein
MSKLVPCPRCSNTDLLRVQQVGWYFVQCYNCEEPFSLNKIIGKTDPDRDKAIDNWNNGVLDERFAKLEHPQNGEQQ